MIRITIEMVPYGIESKKYIHSQATIWNNRKKSTETGGEYGDYEGEIMQSCDFDPNKVWKKSFVKGIHRKKRGVWDILFCFLYNAGLYERNEVILKKEK